MVALNTPVSFTRSSREDISLAISNLGAVIPGPTALRRSRWFTTENLPQLLSWTRYVCLDKKSAHSFSDGIKSALAALTED